MQALNNVNLFCSLQHVTFGVFLLGVVTTALLWAVRSKHFCQENIPDVQAEPPLAQLEAFSPCPLAGYLAEELKPPLATPSCQGAGESHRAPLNLLFFRLKKNKEL